MKKKIWNPSAHATTIQINSTLNILQEKALSISYNPVVNIDGTEHQYKITWQNHQSGRENCGEAFTKLEQYEYILRNNSYHCMLFDGSLIRANFIFEDDWLLSQNLLWWPAPYNYGELLQDGYSPVELVKDFYGDSKWYESIKMRSPIRIDYDSNNDTQYHPKIHMHIQHEDTRLPIQTPICFNKFVDFIFRNFYPDFSLFLSPYDYIEYKISSSNQLEYHSSKIII